MTEPLQTLLVRKLGLQAYEPTWEAMKSFTNQRTPDSLDEIWLLEHPAVYTQGQAGKAEHLLNTKNIPVVAIDRGGQPTHHAPGQLVAYLMIDIKRLKLFPKALVTAIENSVIQTLKSFGVTAVTQPKAPGVYVDDNKICSIGLRIRRGCSYHGLALNVNMDLSGFDGINPCGHAGLSMINLVSLTPKISLAQVETALITTFADGLNYTEIKHAHQTWRASSN